MKKLFFFLVFILHFFCIEAKAQKRYFEWINSNLGSRERILVDSRTYVREIQPNVWKQLAVLNVDTAILSDLAVTFNNNYFHESDGESLLFTVDGTGMVYHFNPNKRILKRLDKTYFRGYNFFAPQFVRKDTLYSFGGTGFWGYSKALTYYDVKLREWQDIRAINFGPESFVHGYQGYSKIADKFFSGAPYRVLPLKGYPKVIDDKLFAFDFKSLQWSILGKINPDLPPEVNNTAIWDGKYFLHFTLSKIFFIEPVKNEVFLFENEKFYFPLGDHLKVQGDTIYIFHENQTTIVKLSKKDLLNQAKFFGVFYTNDNQVIYQYAAITFSVLGFIILGYQIFRKRKNINRKVDSISHFDELELLFLNRFLEPDKESENYVSVVQINEILKIDDKSPEHQRRLRSKFLKDLNLKFLINYKIEEAIIRSKSGDDSRLVYYKLTNEAKELVFDLFDKTKI
ncbi:hypothetical protein [Daejeonella sp.]|uniref:hypothetical protein n=1 Tax=Daejeonella sp. TaxID=2805397 RepID=UPI0025BD54AB|nr:hypothetical protein [Daejeonella sp.]